MQRMQLAICVILGVTLVLAACGGGSTGTFGVGTVVVTSIVGSRACFSINSISHEDARLNAVRCIAVARCVAVFDIQVSGNKSSLPVVRVDDVGR